MNVFISSVIGSLEEARDAAARAIRTLGYEPRRSEDFGARPDTPQQACLAGVREADVIVLILGARYGDAQESGLSATHEEYREAKERKPIMVFVQDGVEPEAAQASFIAEVQAWNSGQFTVSFQTTEDLQQAVTRALHEFTVARSSVALDVDALLREAERLVPGESDVREASICIVVTGGPVQQILRPAELEDESLSDRFMQEAMFGPLCVFEKGAATKRDVKGDQLVLSQDGASVRVTELGSVVIVMSAAERSPDHSFALIEEHVRARIARAVLAAAGILDSIDPVQRISDVVLVLGLLGAGYMGWMMSSEVAASRGSWMTSSAGARVLVHLAPPNRRRAALKQDTDRLVDDLIVLLRRSFRS